ncbi:MAG: OsmC family protein [Chitinophagaceae bacterium]
MTSIELKNLQAPLKDKYREQPDSAIITLKAEGKIGEGMSCKVETGRGLVIAGLHPATGGDGLLACSGDLLLEALVACAGVTLQAVATAIGIEIKDGSVKAEGDLDFRGTLGVSKEVPVGFKTIRLQFNIESNATAEQMESLAKLTERYCVVYQTLVKGVAIETRFVTNNVI